jgi:hypothetical protein
LRFGAAGDGGGAISARIVCKISAIVASCLSTRCSSASSFFASSLFDVNRRDPFDRRARVR